MVRRWRRWWTLGCNLQRPWLTCSSGGLDAPRARLRHRMIRWLERAEWGLADECAVVEGHPDQVRGHIKRVAAGRNLGTVAGGEAVAGRVRTGRGRGVDAQCGVWWRARVAAAAGAAGAWLANLVAVISWQVRLRGRASRAHIG